MSDRAVDSARSLQIVLRNPQPNKRNAAWHSTSPIQGALHPKPALVQDVGVDHHANSIPDTCPGRLPEYYRVSLTKRSADTIWTAARRGEHCTRRRPPGGSEN